MKGRTVELLALALVALMAPLLGSPGQRTAAIGNTITTVGGAGNPSYISSATGTDGMPVISYYDNTYADLKVAHCGDQSCSSGNNVTTVDSGPAAGPYSSIAIGKDGMPVISYYANGDLKVAHGPPARPRR